MDAIERWNPQFPPGRIEAVYLHWSGGDYATVYPAYHFCIVQRKSGIAVAQTSGLTANMRDVRSGGAYAAHTAGRNSYAAGISAMGMRDATPDDFGAYPLTDALVGGLVTVAAAIVRAYGIPIDERHVLTHAEAAISDGYFGTAEDERWDVARLRASPAPLTPREALATGMELRHMIAERAN